MRKSERIRLLEMQVLRLEFQLDSMRASIDALIELNSMQAPVLDANKWYTQKLSKND